MIIGMVIFPNLTQLDLTGPYEVFGRLPATKVLLIAESLEPLKSDNGLLLTPDETFDTAPQIDILFVPGGRGIFEAMQSEKLINFLQQQAVNAKYITSVCTGSLVLAAAGLLTGYKATTHWLSLHLLKMFNVEVIEERVVIDRNRIMLVQTPQTFHSKILLPAFDIDYKDKFTDEATVAEAFGIKVSLVEGEENNIKITRPVDLLIAEKILEGAQ